MSTATDNTQGRRAATQALFPTPVWTIEWDWGDQLSLMAEEVRRQRSADPKGVELSNEGGWHSAHGIMKGQVFSTLYDRICTEVSRINPDLKAGYGWANVNPPGSYNTRHIHPACVLSGVFYVESPEDSGALILEDPRNVALMTKGLPEQLTQPIRLQPKKGMLVMFPAWLPHSVERNNSVRDRISLAFNAKSG